jgi:proliferating cell nuclear antigen
LGLNTVFFAKIVKSHESSQTMYLRYNEENNGHLMISFMAINTNIDETENVTSSSTNSSFQEYDRHFKAALIDLEIDEMDIPEIDYSVEFSLNSSKFYSVVNQLKQFGDCLQLYCTEETIKLSTETETMGNMLVEIKLEELLEFAIEEAKKMDLVFSINYVHNFCQFYKIAKDVHLYFSDDYPMKMTYNMIDGGSLCFYLAPKITD